MSSATEGTGIVISERAQAQLREMLESAEKINAQINTYAAALGAGLDIPDGWQLDIRRMAFVAPPAPPAPETAEPEAEPEAEQPQAEDA